MTIRRYIPISLLFASLAPSQCRAQLDPQPKAPPSDSPAAANAPSISPAEPIVAILPYALDVKKLKPGDTVTLDVPSRDFPAYARAHVIARIVDARPRTHEKSESRLVLRFETANSDPRKRVALRLELQAVASPSAVQWTTPVVIDDRFPCDPKVARNGCEQQNEDDEDSVESRLSKPQIIICDPSPAKDKKQQACASPRDSHGIYGYPGLSLAPPLADSPDASSIVSVKNNVKLEERTYFILAGPGVETILKKYP